MWRLKQFPQKSFLQHSYRYFEQKKGMAEAIPTISQTSVFMKASVVDRLGHAETGILADIDLVEHLFGTPIGEHQSAEDGGDEAERDRDDARVLQFQDRLAETHDGRAVFAQNIFPGFLKSLGVLFTQCGPGRKCSLFLLHGDDDLLGALGNQFRIGHVGGNHNKTDRGDRTDHQAGDNAGGVELAPEQRQDDDRQVAGGGHGKGQGNQVGNVGLLGHEADHDTDSADNQRGDAGSHDLLMLVGMAVLDDVDIDVVGDGGRGSQNQTGDDRQDGGEGDRAEEGQEDVAEDRSDVGAQLLGQHQGSHVAARVNRNNSLGGQVDGGAETEQCGQDVEAADDEHRDDDGLAGSLCSRHGEEAHQDVRHAGGDRKSTRLNSS